MEVHNSTRSRYGPFPGQAIRQAETLVLQDEHFENRSEAVGVTIDGPTTRDVDDAIWIEEKDKGYLVNVSIADVTSVIDFDSPVDIEAYRRVQTKYRPYGNEPMIPRSLSEDKLSLMEKEKRLTLTVSIPFDEDLEPGEAEIKKTFLVSNKQMTYEETDNALDNPESEYYSMLKLANKFAQVMLDKRRQKGALAIYDLKKGIKTTSEGKIIELADYERHRSNIIIQEFMIATNEAVARVMLNANIHGFYRNHRAHVSAPETKEEIRKFQEEILNQLNLPQHFTLATIQKRVNFQVQRAKYGRKNEGHYGLRSPAYTHFTSPIRRYADIVVHRNIHNLLDSTKHTLSPDQLDKAAHHINETIEADKETIKIREESKLIASARRNIKTGKVEQILNLKSGDFIKLLEIACSEEESLKNNPALVSAISLRILDRKLNPKENFMILFESNNSEEWMQLKKEVIGSLVQSPDNCVALFAYAKQTKGWSNIKFTTQAGGRDHEPIFTTSAIVKIPEQFESNTIKAKTKKESEQLAAVDLLLKITGHDIQYLSSVPSEADSIQVQEPVPDKELKTPVDINVNLHNTFELTIDQEGTLKRCNPKGTLNNLVSQKGWKKPVIENRKAGGSSHTPIFSSEVTLIAQEFGPNPISSGKVSVRGKQIFSEQLACALILIKTGYLEQESLNEILLTSEKYVQETVESEVEKIDLNFGVLELNSKELESLINENPKGTLNQLCQGKKWNLPQWVTHQSGGTSNEPIFSSIAIIEIPNHSEPFSSREFFIRGQAKIAEQLAAKDLLEQLLKTEDTFRTNIPNDKVDNILKEIKNDNMIGALQNLCQLADSKLGNCHKPHYTRLSFEEGFYRFKAELKILGQAFEVIGVSEIDSKKAQHDAAREMLMLVWTLAFPSESGVKNPF